MVPEARRAVNGLGTTISTTTRQSNITPGDRMATARTAQWAVRFALIGAASMVGGALLTVLQELGFLHAIAYGLAAVPLTPGCWITYDLARRRVLTADTLHKVQDNAIKLGLLWLITTIVALLQIRIKPSEGLGLAVATIGGIAVWSTFAESLSIWLRARIFDPTDADDRRRNVIAGIPRAIPRSRRHARAANAYHRGPRTRRVAGQCRTISVRERSTAAVPSSDG